MKVDYYPTPGPLAGVAERAAWARDTGFDGLFTAETGHDPFLPLAVAAEAGSGLDLGTAIAVAFARSPMTVAYTAWDLAARTDGRFLLGLGTQIKAHIVRRFSMPWSRPAARLREYIAALRAIWVSWQHGTPLRFEGEFYRHNLMTPFFSPAPIEHPDIPVYVAGVGEHLCRLAGEVAQGFHVHPFHTIAYLDRVVLPNLRAGAARSGRTLDDIERVATVFVVTGGTDEQMGLMRQAVKLQAAFYASTPAYRGVLDLHGWDFGSALTALSKQGDWLGMGNLIPDEVVDQIAVTAPLDELGAAIRERFGSRVQRTGFYVPELPGVGPLLELSDDNWRRIVTATRG